MQTLTKIKYKIKQWHWSFKMYRASLTKTQAVIIYSTSVIILAAVCGLIWLGFRSSATNVNAKLPSGKSSSDSNSSSAPSNSGSSLSSSAGSAQLSTDVNTSSQNLTKVLTDGGRVYEIRNIKYGTESPLEAMDVFLPPNPNPNLPVLLVVHGGGFVQGDKSDNQPEAEGVATVGWAGVNINYQVNGYPHESNDVLTAIEWLRDNAGQLGINPNKIALLGTSAGANLVAEAATVAREAKVNLGIVAVVSWSGPMDLYSFGQTATQGAFKALNYYLGCPVNSCSSLWQAASPYYQVESGDPPMYLFNSTMEAIPLDQATSMVSKLQSAGDSVELYTLDGKLHAMQYATTAYQPSVDWLTKYLGPINGTLPVVPSNPTN